ncbi:hypothetical protein Misp01_08280 [Microtetraspora sp. NBRC 13810]|uniref:AfsR/SARP family transcriptional regulator n=1 Tax=Microtetraspora sp. NBRC 13810 TaxID=3030990 RepID=UPI0024A2331B|nr:AfsR/SARP family transcriptional regulator [Microtetraspora sp. NBRC 13810]GLW05698.1 hypothetical protein Misp01_08280 [Microtetraspora sp. NBRC 13810]
MLEFQVLGPLEVRYEGVPVALGAAMWRRLLAVMLCRPGEPVAVDDLIDALWPGAPPRSARKTLQVYVRRLREAIGQRERIVHSAAGYAAVVAPVELDALRFAGLVAEARGARDRADLGAAAVLFEQGLGLWHGTAYAGIGEVQPVADEVRRLEEQRLLAYEDLVAVDLALGRQSGALDELPQMAELHPYRERLHGYLMLALRDAGRQSEALEVYARTRNRLSDELGVEPGPLLGRVHRAVLRGDQPASRTRHVLELPPAARDRVVVPPGAGPCLLPPDIIDFTGRIEHTDALLGHLTGLGTGTATEIVTLTGMAGAGKTTIAVHAAHRLRREFPDGRLYVDLHGSGPRPADPRAVLGRLLLALGVDREAMPGGLDERAEMFRAMLAGRRVLTVLDDAADEAQIRPLLPGGPACAVLVTGRRALTGLSARPLRVEPFDPLTSEALLARVAGPERVAAEHAAATEITRLCGHLPLAVRIAGALLAGHGHWRLARLADRLRPEDRRLGELAVGDLSVRHSLDQSHRTLAPRTKRAFMLLGAADAADFTAQTLAALLDTSVREAEAHLDELLNAELLRCHAPGQDGPTRYLFHPLVRLYAREHADRHRGALLP